MSISNTDESLNRSMDSLRSSSKEETATDSTSGTEKEPSVLSYQEAAILLFAFLMTALVLVVAFFWGNEGGSSGNITVTLQPSSSPLADPCASSVATTNDAMCQTKMDWLINQLRNVVELPAGPFQHQALEWMVSQDSTNVLGGGGGEPSVHPDRLVQRYALLVFYFSTGRWSRHPGWANFFGTFMHECSWPGVVCDLDDRYVVRLDVSAKLGVPRGTIPSEIGLLTNLGTYYIHT